MKYSIIIPCFNSLALTISCIESVRKHSKDFELILVDDLSTDGTIEYLRKESITHRDTFCVFHEQNLGFSHSVNSGIDQSTGNFIVLLNSDTVVTPGWLESMCDTFPKAEKQFRISRVGAVGPVSNYAGGDQGIDAEKYSLEQLDHSAVQHRATYKNNMLLSGFLSGFCVMIRREVINDIGLFSTIYPHGFWEDNDYCLRMLLAGWNLVIDQSTFIHHHGSASFRTLKIDPNYLLRSNQLKFFGAHYHEKPQKLITVIRTHNQAELLESAISNASIYSDGIVVLLDRCTDSSLTIATSFTKVVKVIDQHKPFDEARDRQLLIDDATKYGADWILSLDSDEIIEDAFTYEYAHKLMNPIDPQVLAYGFNFKTFFLGQTHYRTDGTFGELWGVRFWRVLKHQAIQSHGHEGLHCTHGPFIPMFNTRRLRTRVKHYGYDSIEKCIDKFQFYSTLDKKPDLVKTSPIGYKHIIADNINVNRWKETNDITLCMCVHNEETNLFSFLARYYVYFDDIVIVDTHSSDQTKKVANLFGCRLFNHKWHDSFSELRNFALEQCKTKWVLSMDPDEEIIEKDIPTLWHMIEENVDGWLFKFLNFQKDGSIVYSDNVRLFRNIPKLYWSWRCHENMAPSISESNLTILTAPFDLRHYGFLKEGKDHDRKLNQYGSMLKKQIKEFPKEPIGYFHLAFHEFEEGHQAAGIKLLKKAASLKPEFFLAHKEIALYYLKEAHKYFSKAAVSIPQGHYYSHWLNKVKSLVEDILIRPLDK